MLAITAALIVQRWELAQLAQWREDQATNLWLGSQIWQGHYLPAIGLISSIGTPNPNGMPWLGFFLSPLPSLQVISFSLSLLQFWLLARLCRLLCTTPLPFWAAFLTSASCLQVVLTSVEFWNQWVISLVNLAFFSEVLRLRNRVPPFWPLFIAINCLLAAPALYVAGVVNSACYALVLIFLFLRYPITWADAFRRPWQKFLWATAAILHGAAVWIPYAMRVDAGSLHGLARPFSQRIAESAFSLLKLPFTFNTLVPATLAGLDQDSPGILPAFLATGLSVSHFVIVVGLIATITGALFEKKLPAATWILFFCLLMCCLSPLLGGFAWGLGQRPDQIPQFFPLLLIAALGSLPTNPRWSRAALIVALAFAALQFVLSAQLHRALMNYRGAEMTDADLPLPDRRQAVDFIASDWVQHAKDTPMVTKIPVYYAFGASWTGLVDRYGALLAQWYPDDPYTVGRGYDWELLRRWKLENRDEGLAQADRKWNGHRYTISMVGLPPPSFLPQSARHFEFGRVRVSIVESP